MKFTDVSDRLRQLDAPKNLSDNPVVATSEVGVFSYTPEKDGKGKCTEVHLVINIEGIRFGVCLKSGTACDLLIAALTRHRMDVFG